MADLFVSVPQVQVKLEDGTNRTLTRGDMVPSNTSAESLGNLKDLGFVRSDGELTHDELAGHADVSGAAVADQFDDMGVDDLKAAIDERNASLPDDQQLSKSGNKAELQARLRG